MYWLVVGYVIGSLLVSYGLCDWLVSGQRVVSCWLVVGQLLVMVQVIALVIYWICYQLVAGQLLVSSWLVFGQLLVLLGRVWVSQRLVIVYGIGCVLVSYWLVNGYVIGQFLVSYWLVMGDVLVIGQLFVIVLVSYVFWLVV